MHFFLSHSRIPAFFLSALRSPLFALCSLLSAFAFAFFLPSYHFILMLPLIALAFIMASISVNLAAFSW
jgi:hypothetical protein